MPKIVAALRIAQVAGMAAGNTQPRGVVRRCGYAGLLSSTRGPRRACATYTSYTSRPRGRNQATRFRPPSDMLGPTGEELDILPGRSLDRVDGRRATPSRGTASSAK
ncbi:hypothetical protein PJI17_28555 [Mycobacterium kansasii]